MIKIEVKDYSKIIKGVTILDSVNVTFKSGKCYGLKGKNGSGKTMLMRAVSGLIVPTKGQVIIDDEVLGKDISFPRSIGVLIENPAFMEQPDIVILDEPINAIDEVGVRKVKQLIEEAKKRGAIIITACHDAHELEELSDEIIQISEGRIVEHDN